MQSNRKVMITRRRRRRVFEQRPKYLLYLGYLLLGLVAVIALSIVGTFLVAVGSAYAVYDSFAQQLPDPSAIETEQEDFETSKIYDRTGKVLLYELFDPYRGDRSYVKLTEIPEFCRDATIVLEDKNFYQNLGFDVEGIGRAFWQNLQGGQVQGGSSITQQLIKNILIDQEERTKLSYTRKLKELILAVEITRRFSKDQILEWYFNTNSYFNLAYGIDAAARVYFDKPASALSKAECAMLAPIPQFPFLNPINSPDEAKYRQWITLKRMVEEGAITEAEAKEIYAEPVEVRQMEQRFDIKAPHFAMYVREELERKFDPDLVYRGGLKVYTSLDYDLNEQAQKIAVDHINELKENKNNASNACVVSINPKTGEILAMVGSVDFWDKDNDGNVNVCTANPGRQPGSSFKPFSYLTMFSQGVYNAATMIMNVRQSFPDDPNPPYVPENYDRKYTGPVRARYALAQSLNIPAVWTLHKAGIKNVIATAHRLGITTLNQDYYGLALTLGGGEVKPLDMAYAYSVLANMGTMAGEPVPEVDRRPGHRTLNPVSILRIEDKNGNVIYEYKQPTTEQVIDPALAYLMDDILSDNNARAAAFGSNSVLKKDFEDRPIAAKTGTTNNFRDNWTVGFTPQLATAVWVGNNDNSEMKDVTGLSGAAPIWHDVMLYYLQNKPVEEWIRPPGLTIAPVDAVSGLKPTENTPQVAYEMFLDGTEPKQPDSVHQVFRINRENGKLATVYTPPELVEERVYEVFPPVANDWARENGIPQPPTEYDDSIGPAVNAGPVAFINPRPYEYVKGSVVITGNANIDGFQLYRVEYGQGLNPTEWKQLGGDNPAPVEGGPLAVWDTAAEEEGLYTLQLTVVRGDQSFERRSIQVTVDNTPPVVELINPEPDTVYQWDPKPLLNDWVNFQVDAKDNLSMSRVEYYLDNQKIGETTVAPYTLRWTVELTQTAIRRYEAPITTTEVISQPDGTLLQSAPITLTEVLTVTQPITDPLELANLPEGEFPEKFIGYQKVFSGGHTIISTTLGYTETHMAYIVAYDSAGNKTESERVPIQIIPKKEEKKEEGEAYAPAAIDDRQRRVLAN
ncbi:MAG: Monofunctional biosynthetic peptidoglycan transglycosylase [Anaerolineae bacterium]|nr:Monofunctional biosynthetic peptidoglycan transglycosylase [Anaerolineae bacterium]